MLPIGLTRLNGDIMKKYGKGKGTKGKGKKC